MSLEAANAAMDATTVRLDGSRIPARRRRPPCWRRLAAWARGPTRSMARTRRRALPSTPRLAGWLVDAIDARWVELGCPDPFTLVEIGAGDGTRAAAFLAAGPACLTALRYVLVESDPVLRDRQRAHLPIESPILVLGPVGPADQEDDDDLDDERTRRAVAGIGPLITSLPEPPVVDGAALVVAVGWVEPPAVGSPGVARRPVVGDPPGRRSAAAAICRSCRSRWTRSAPPAAERLAGSGDHRPRPDGARYAVLSRRSTGWPATLRIAGSGRLMVIDRWTEVTRPLAPGEAPPLALDQLAAVRRPLEAAPVSLFPECR